MGKLSINLPKFTIERVLQTFSEVYDWGLRDLNVPDIHKETLGHGIKVAVIDSGKSSHFETKDAIVSAKNFSASSTLDDKNGHSCVHPEAYIWTSRGLEKIQDFYSRIEKPEMVFQEMEDSFTKYVGNCGIHCNSFNKVSKKFEFDHVQYVHKVRVNDENLRVQFGKNRHVKLTKDHPAYILEDNEVHIVDAQELKIGDKLICNSEMSEFLSGTQQALYYGSYLSCESCGHKIKTVKSHKGRRQCKKCNKSKWTTKHYKRIFDEEWSYLAGLILTDGHIHYKPRERFIQICNTDNKIIARATQILRKKGFEPSVYADKRQSHIKTVVVRNKELCEFFIELGIPSGNKTRISEVPKVIQTASSKLVLAFLAGVIDGDGSIGQDSKVRIATGSHQFAEQMTYWLLSRGIRANYCVSSGVGEAEIRGRSIEFEKSWCITLYNPPGISKWMVSSKRYNLKPDIQRRQTIVITDIQTEPFEGYFYDLTMRHNPNYTGNGVVVSNTFCAGIIAARKNDEGIIGVAPKSKLYFAKAMDDSGAGEPSALVKAINWATKQKVDIMSISAGMFFDFKPLRKAIKRAYQNNIIIVAAVGNTGTRQYDVAFPARYPEVIGVAAYDQKHKVARFSSRGTNVSFAMPGVNIYSTYLNNQFCRMSGTSFACPIMAGICALILAKHREAPSSTPCKTPKQMMEHLKKYAKKLNGRNETGFGNVDLEGVFADD